VDDRVDSAHGVAKGRRVGEIAKRDLHAYALRPKSAWIAHKAAHPPLFGDEPAQERRANEAGGSGEQEHRPKLAECAPHPIPGCVARMREAASLLFVVLSK